MFLLRRAALSAVSVLALAAAAPTLAQEATAAASLAAETDPTVLDQVIVTGSRQAAREAAGAATYLDEEALAAFGYGDVNRVLRQAPGVFLQEEDGWGLRPNIGIRGSGTDRSGRIALMEDGVLIAPAPYAAPAAYYFPRLARAHGVEVVKGPAAIQYGPQTTGGAVQIFSTPIPRGEGLSGRATVVGGDYGSLRAHGIVGGWLPADGGLQVGASVEGLRESTDGFKDLDSGGGTGFEIDDWVFKLGLRSGEGAAMPQSLELKFQTYDERSDETYVGLTLADFEADPFRRYRGSQADVMNVAHETWQATHRIELSPTLELTTIAYRTETARAWYKLNDVLAGGALRSVASVLENPGLYADGYATLVGAPGYVSPDGALRVRNNNRAYEATGVQTVLTARFDTGTVGHTLQASARWHQDSEDRFQQDDRYRMDDGVMVLTSAGAPGTQDNRLGEAEAWALFVRDEISAGPLTLTPGLRYETIDLTQTRWAAGDAARATPTAVAERTVDVWIPGVGATWRLSPEWLLLAGVHRGFANPGPGSDVDPETSWSWEAGVRYDGAQGLAVEAIGFLNDYDNLVGTCTASTGAGCVIGDQFDGGAVEVMGLELTAGWDLGAALGWPVAAPVSAVYTFTQAEFGTSFVSDYGPWGTVAAGDELPYLPQHQLTLNLGLRGGRWRADLTVNRVGEARAEAGSGPIPAGQRIDARTLADLAAEFSLTDQVALFGSVQNLTDEVYNVGFSPAGARPGAPRIAMAGVRLRF